MVDLTDGTVISTWDRLSCSSIEGYAAPAGLSSGGVVLLDADTGDILQALR